jgi:dihydroorotase
VPGLIDLHVHLRVPGPGEAETIETGTRAAAEGGVTTLVTMPNTEPVVDTPARVRSLSSMARSRGAVNVLVAAALTRGQGGRELADLERLAAAGAAAFSEDGRPVMNAELMRRALVRARKLGLRVLDHAEDLDLAGAGVLHEGRAARRLGVPGISAASETLAVRRDIALAELTGGPLHVCHVSCAESVELVREAKRRGLDVTCEAAPHHFTLCDDDVPGSRRAADFKMKPPLRTRADREALLEGLADGTVDAIATDHAPHTPRRKALGLARAPFGVIGLETLLPLSMALVRRGVLRPRRLVELLSSGPARILGLKSKGRLAPGADADVTLIDPRASWLVDGRFASLSRNSPFTGRRLRGLAAATVVGGRLVFQRGGTL